MCVLFFFKLPIKRRIYDNGKEGSVRETQEGCPSPLKSVVFEALKKLQKLRQRAEKTFSARWDAHSCVLFFFTLRAFGKTPLRPPPSPLPIRKDGEFFRKFFKILILL